jgi:hypothetical protein
MIHVSLLNITCTTDSARLTINILARLNVFQVLCALLNRLRVCESSYNCGTVIVLIRLRSAHRPTPSELECRREERLAEGTGYASLLTEEVLEYLHPDGGRVCNRAILTRPRFASITSSSAVEREPNFGSV